MCIAIGYGFYKYAKIYVHCNWLNNTHSFHSNKNFVLAFKSCRLPPSTVACKLILSPLPTFQSARSFAQYKNHSINTEAERAVQPSTKVETERSGVEAELTAWPGAKVEMVGTEAERCHTLGRRLTAVDVSTIKVRDKDAGRASPLPWRLGFTESEESAEHGTWFGHLCAITVSGHTAPHDSTIMET